MWTTDCQQAFGKLRLLLSQAPVLAHPNFKNSFTLDTDASDNGIGAVLSQIGEDGEEHVIAYGSRLLTKPERNYCVTRKELLAVVYFVDQYRPYLLGQEFTLRTDHGSLTWLRNFKVFSAGSMHKRMTRRIMSSRLYQTNCRRKSSVPCTKVSLEATWG